MLAFGAIAVLVWIGGQDVLGGRTTAGELVAFIFYAFIVAGSVGAISEVWTDLQRAAGATERLVELMESSSAVRDGSVDELAPWQSLDLSVTNLAFRYASRPDQPVLQDLSFNVQPGEMVALVGPSAPERVRFLICCSVFTMSMLGR